MRHCLLFLTLAACLTPLSAHAFTPRPGVLPIATYVPTTLGEMRGETPSVEAAVARIWGEEARRHELRTLSWELPAPAYWEFDGMGKPIVETQQLQELWHTLKRGQSLGWIQNRYKLSAKSLTKLNPGVDLRVLKTGDEVRVWKRAPGKISTSVGDPARGKLKHGEPLPPGEKYVVLHPHRAFGTYYATSEISRVMTGYAEAYPDAEPVIVGDLSLRHGRKLSPHQSHRSGRDVDITYPRTTPPPNYRRFNYIARRDIAVERTLWMLHEFLKSGMVEYVFIDRPIQRLLYNEAKGRGAPDAWLKAVFQYPRHAGTGALVRRARGHDDHLHIRFVCQPTDKRCKRPFRERWLKRVMAAQAREAARKQETPKTGAGDSAGL